MRCEGADNPPCRRCISNGEPGVSIYCSYAVLLLTLYISLYRGRLCKSGLSRVRAFQGRCDQSFVLVPDTGVYKIS